MLLCSVGMTDRQSSNLEDVDASKVVQLLV